MTGKLIKYESKSSIRLMGIIWIALIAASFILGITFKMFDRLVDMDSYSGAGELFVIIPSLLYVGIFVAMTVISVLMIILRFYRGMIGDEGYLMYTLPVKVWQLITSKGIVAGGIVLVSCIAAAISMLVLGLILEPSGVADFFVSLFRLMKDEPKYILIGIEVIIILVASILKSVYQIYAAMAVGQLSGKYRGLVSLGAYIGISMAIALIALAAVMIADATGLDYWLANFGVNMNLNPSTVTQFGILAAFLLTALQLAIFHVIAERILSLKLNLQ